MNQNESTQKEDLTSAYSQLERTVLKVVPKGTTPYTTDTVVSFSLTENRVPGKLVGRGDLSVSVFALAGWSLISAGSDSALIS